MTETTPESENTGPSDAQGVAPASNPELKNILEAALLVAGQPLTIDRMLGLFQEDARPTRDEIRAGLAALSEECAGRGVELMQIDNAWRFQSKQKYAEWLPPRAIRARASASCASRKRGSSATALSKWARAVSVSGTCSSTCGVSSTSRAASGRSMAWRSMRTVPAWARSSKSEQV